MIVCVAATLLLHLNGFHFAPHARERLWCRPLDEDGEGRRADRAVVQDGCDQLVVSIVVDVGRFHRAAHHRDVELVGGAQLLDNLA